VTAERACLAALGGGCQTASGALARLEGTRLLLSAAMLVGGRLRRVEETGEADDPRGCGERAARHLLEDARG